MMIEKIKAEITKASNYLGSNKLVYEINFWFGVSQSLKISGVELLQNPNYDLMFEYGNGINEKELVALEQQGFLIKVSETIDKYDPPLSEE
jgi:3'-phosphoadenosine 5'-phosphosulfate sulfotransferase